MTLIPLKLLLLKLLPERHGFELREWYRNLFRRGTMEGQKTFILGMGAQKAGTTWLHDHLTSHPSVNMGFTKEYHVFDGLYITNEEVRELFIDNKYEAVSGKNGKPDYTMELLVSFIEDIGNYFRYFEHIVSVKKTVYLTGDISPCYCALPVGILSHIKNSLINHGMRPCVIFMMRDPVERCISATRMLLKAKGVPWTSEDENRHLESHFRSEVVGLRTRYDQTIRNIETVFSNDEILYLFYEDMFNDATLRQVHEFLGLSHIPGDFAKEVNVSRTDNVIDPELRRQIYFHYRTVYEFVAERFGEERVNMLWKNRTAFENK